MLHGGMAHPVVDEQFGETASRTRSFFSVWKIYADFFFAGRGPQNQATKHFDSLPP